MPEYTSTTVYGLSYGQYFLLKKDNLVRMRIDDARAPELIPYLPPPARFTHRFWCIVWMLLIPVLVGLLIARQFIIAAGVLLLVIGMPKAIRTNTATAIEALAFENPHFFELLNALRAVRFTVYSPKD